MRMRMRIIRRLRRWWRMRIIHPFPHDHTWYLWYESQPNLYHSTKPYSHDQSLYYGYPYHCIYDNKYYHSHLSLYLELYWKQWRNHGKLSRS
jgi:hypothetical protein